MNAKDYLKRGFSAVFNEDNPLRTIATSFATAASLAVGYGVAVYEEPATTTTASAAIQKEAISNYLSEIQTFKMPEVAGQGGWAKLDTQMKNFSERLVLDERLSETDVSKVVTDFKVNTRFKPPQYLWMLENKSSKGTDVIPDMNYLQECRAAVSLNDVSDRAKTVYGCAIDKEKTNRLVAYPPAVLGGIVGFLTLMLGGGLGQQWKEEYRRKRHQEADAFNSKRNILSPEDMARYVEKSESTQTPSTKIEDVKPVKVAPKLKLD